MPAKTKTQRKPPPGERASLTALMMVLVVAITWFFDQALTYWA